MLRKFGPAVVEVFWPQFKAEVLRLLSTEATISITRNREDESYKATLVRFAGSMLETDPALNRVELEIEPGEVKVKKNRRDESFMSFNVIEDATLPAILQFFVPDFVREVVKRREKVTRILNDLDFLRNFQAKKGEAGRNQKHSLD